MEQKQKYIVIAVTGSIACYKSCDLVRNLVKQGYPVQVILSSSAEKLVGKASFQALSQNKVLTSEWEDEMLHIDIKNHAAIFAVTPATANTIAKMAHGAADELISSTYLALQCPVIIAPSMNPNMYNHPSVQRNIATLQQDGVFVISPHEGEVVCGDSGRGKMAPIQDIEKTLTQIYEKGHPPN